MGDSKTQNSTKKLRKKLESDAFGEVEKES